MMTQLTLRDLKRIEPLIRRKQRYLDRLAALNRQLETFGGSRSNGLMSSGKIGGNRTKPDRNGHYKPGKSGSLINRIKATLKAAGKAGLSLKELAAACKTSRLNISSSICYAQKHGGGIERIGWGRYWSKA